MSAEKLITSEIESIKDNGTKLYAYLYDLFYSGKVRNINFLEGVFSSFLEDKRSSIRRIAIYGLLFGLQIQKDKYRKKALEFVQDSESNFDLRLFSLSGLSQAYQGTKDKELLEFFYSLYSIENEDPDIRATCFAGMLRIFELTTVEIATINGNVIITMDDIDLNKFSEQLIAIRKIIGRDF